MQQVQAVESWLMFRTYYLRDVELKMSFPGTEVHYLFRIKIYSGTQKSSFRPAKSDSGKQPIAPMFSPFLAMLFLVTFFSVIEQVIISIPFSNSLQDLQPLLLLPGSLLLLMQ